MVKLHLELSEWKGPDLVNRAYLAMGWSCVALGVAAGAAAVGFRSLFFALFGMASVIGGWAFLRASGRYRRTDRGVRATPTSLIVDYDRLLPLLWLVSFALIPAFLTVGTDGRIDLSLSPTLVVAAALSILIIPLAIDALLEHPSITIDVDRVRYGSTFNRAEIAWDDVCGARASVVAMHSVILLDLDLEAPRIQWTKRLPWERLSPQPALAVPFVGLHDPVRLMGLFAALSRADRRGREGLIAQVNQMLPITGGRIPPLP